MKTTFLNHEKPLLTVMLQCETPDVAIGRVRNALQSGGEAFGLQVGYLLEGYQNADTYRKIFKEMRGKPIYVTNYRGHRNLEKTADELEKRAFTVSRLWRYACGYNGRLI